MKRIILTLAALALFAGSAQATTNYANALREESNRGANTPMVKFAIPAMSSADTTICSFNTQRLIQWNSKTSVGNMTFVYGWNTATAADSATVSCSVGWTANGPWESVSVSTLQANTLTGAVHYVIKSDQALTTVFPLPYFRIALACKSTTMAVGATGYVAFPQIGSSNRPFAGP